MLLSHGLLHYFILFYFILYWRLIYLCIEASAKVHFSGSLISPQNVILDSHYQSNVLDVCIKLNQVESLSNLLLSNSKHFSQL